MDAFLHVFTLSAVAHIGLNVWRRSMNKDMFTFMLQRVAVWGY
jgi:hypothetical protein